MPAFFITGTDTNIGKTYVTCLLAKEFNALGLETLAIKPVASGCQYKDNFLQNEDALCLQAASSIKKPYQTINPIALQDPIAPHLAAHKMGIVLSKSLVQKSICSSLQPDPHITMIEGVGGWSVPLNENELFSDVISELNLPVILVVGIKLGCLNHAILTYKNILASKVPLIGWIANCLDHQTLSIHENIETLKIWIKHPCLGVIPYKGQELGYINIDLIRNDHLNGLHTFNSPINL